MTFSNATLITHISYQSRRCQALLCCRLTS